MLNKGVERVTKELSILTKSDIVNLIREDEWMMDVLRTVRELQLPDSCVCAGFLRNKIWDFLHGYTKPTPLADVDVVYFDPHHHDQGAERVWETKLQRMRPGIPWSVKNQARMHLRNQDPPYSDTSDALAHFLETPTAVGASLNEDGEIRLFTPHGLDDLVQLIVRPTPTTLQHIDTKGPMYAQRIKDKKWKEQWPLLSFDSRISVD